MLEKFKDYILINGGAWLTATNYISRITKVLTVVKEEDFSEETLASFLRELQKKNSVSTVNGYLNALTAYLKFIKKEIPLPKYLKEVKTLPQSFDENELEHIIDVLSQTLNKDFLKCKAILMFLFYTGVRIGSFDTLKRSHFDLNIKTAQIYASKTKEEYLVTYTTKTAVALKEYFETEEELTNDFNMSSNSFQQRIKGWKYLFPEISLHAHIFRHSFAVNCLKKGVDVSVLKELMNHKDIKMTERYLKLTNKEIFEIYRKKVDN